MTKQTIKTVAIILKPADIDDLPNIITNLIRWLDRRGKKIYMLNKEKKRLSKYISPKKIAQIDFVEGKFLFSKSNLLISLGGDGTLLGVCRNVSSVVPVFSVNLGKLGFITEFEQSEFYEKLNLILLGKYIVSKKHTYKIDIVRQGKRIETQYFFNDAVFTKNDIARMFTLTVEADGEHIYNLSGDGLIISSTYGSTAYSLAAGGPIVHPDVKALILTPICPHSLTHRPLVIPDNQTLQFCVKEKITTVNITVDGQECISLMTGDTVIIAKGRRLVTLIKNKDKTYFHTLKEKFVYGKREA